VIAKVSQLASMSDDTLSARFRQTGLKLTAPRRAVIALLGNRPAEHLSAEEVYQALRAQGVSIHLSSVYRTLNLLAGLGLMHRIFLSDAHAHFEFHHQEEVHLVCVVCGNVEEAPAPADDSLGRSLRQLAEKRGFEATRFQVKVEGRCRQCAWGEQQREGGKLAEY
jgi:Fur family ferric uptake transcriptional regulator